jgi:benzodiazapine receptor
MKKTKFFSLIIWITILILMSSLIGFITKPEISTWYNNLNRSPITAPNYLFPIVWTILYSMIAISGWLLWSSQKFEKLKIIKRLYIIQLFLNWSWSPFFFHYHFISLSLLILMIMDLLVTTIILLAFSRIRLVAILMIPYLSWIVFATYLNFYIWQNN